MTPPLKARGDVTERLVWIDWLKVIIVFAVFVYHVAEPFFVINWVVSNNERSYLLSALAGFTFLFGMPLMFLVTGATTWLSLGQRSITGYGMNRVRRLLLPWSPASSSSRRCSGGWRPPSRGAGRTR